MKALNPYTHRLNGDGTACADGTSCAGDIPCPACRWASENIPTRTHGPECEQQIPGIYECSCKETRGMTIDDLIAALQNLKEHGSSGSEIVLAYNGDVGAVVPVTGYLIDDETLELQTDYDGECDEG